MQNEKQSKIIVIGDSSIGKTTLIKALTDENFDISNSTISSTIGVEYFEIKAIFENTQFSMNLYDTAGQEYFRSVTTPYYRGSNIVLLCVCLTNEWEKSIGSWLNEITNYAEFDTDIIFVATKNDTYSNQLKDFEKLKTIASNTQFHNCVISTSSKNRNGLSELMDKMVELSYQHVINKSHQKSFIKVHKTVDDPISSEKKCCSN